MMQRQLLEQQLGLGEQKKLAIEMEMVVLAKVDRVLDALINSAKITIEPNFSE